ncbi:CHAP domain-containing protein [Novosphingobium sp. 9]|uniref:CHAP domain-containing protein n=1 Tax=Novosphingobium sp. 9 TaxID=2025349 RepID=UPI0021B6BE83|nr:CHAP domain-containing protein [Novosphingobium sp. 9]
MKALFATATLALSALTMIAPAHASGRIDTVVAPSDSDGGSDVKSPGYLECVPFARKATGIKLYGDARTWWGQAQGRYATGSTPQVGAVMAFQPYRNSVLGHVAAVTKIIDSRTILVSHANWSPIDGERGQIERNVTVLDVSPANDWSEVRVWYAPIQNLGAAHWPVEGFIYPGKPGKHMMQAKTRLAMADAAPAKSRNGDAIGEILSGDY